MPSKIIYVANVRLPTEKAHGIQIMKMCEAFAENGVGVELIVPNRKTHIINDPFEYYQVKPIFKIRKLWCIDSVMFGRLGFILQTVTFAESVALHMFLNNGIFYTRDETVGFFLKALGKKVVWEAHMGQQNLFAKFLIWTKVPLVVITQGLKNLYVDLGVKEKKVHVAPDGVDLEQFNIAESKEEAREAVGIGIQDKIVLYTGHLYSWKGADTLALAAHKIASGSQILFVGGTEKDILSFKKKYISLDNVAILGNKPHHDIPLYLRAADMLVIPNSAKEDISRLYTSPMKLFEYMASGTPIISSDLPALREILDESRAYFFEPDNATSLAKVIDKAVSERNFAENKARKALEEVREYSWKKRAAKILDFIS